MRPTILFSSAALAATLVFGGCIGKPAPSQKLFVLPTSSPVGSGPHAGVLGDRSLGVGPVSIASHLDKHFVAVRLEETRYEYADSMQWASPLDLLFQERLEEGLSWATGVTEVLRFPWGASNAPDVRVSARVARFELTTDGQAELTVHWSIRHGESGAPVDSGLFQHREALRGRSAAAGVEAMDRALLRFAVAVAEELGR
jgi:uncharacterized lipoprotein YmbA